MSLRVIAIWMNAEPNIDAILQFSLEGEFVKRQGSISKTFLDKTLNTLHHRAYEFIEFGIICDAMCEVLFYNVYQNL